MEDLYGGLIGETPSGQTSSLLYELLGQLGSLQVFKSHDLFTTGNAGVCKVVWWCINRDIEVMVSWERGWVTWLGSGVPRKVERWRDFGLGKSSSSDIKIGGSLDLWSFLCFSVLDVHGVSVSVVSSSSSELGSWISGSEFPELSSMYTDVLRRDVLSRNSWVIDFIFFWMITSTALTFVDFGQ